MDMILNVGNKAVIPPILPKFKPFGSNLSTGLTQRDIEDFGYVSDDDETMSTVSEDSYCEESVSLIPRQNLSISRTEVQTMKADEVEFPSQMHLPFNSLKPMEIRQCREPKAKTGTDLELTLDTNMDNVLRAWEYIQSPGYDPRRFPFYTKESFLKWHGDLLRRRLEKDRIGDTKARAFPDPKPAPQSKSWGVGSFFDALWGK
jgi:hypothetical protein